LEAGIAKEEGSRKSTWQTFLGNAKEGGVIQIEGRRQARRRLIII